jgi:hypothetical protein
MWVARELARGEICGFMNSGDGDRALDQPGLL